MAAAPGGLVTGSLPPTVGIFSYWRRAVLRLDRDLSSTSPSWGWPRRRAAGVLARCLRRWGLLLWRRAVLRLDRIYTISTSPSWGWPRHPDWSRLLARCLRRRDLQLWRRGVLRLDGHHSVLNEPIVGMAATLSDGYWLVASDGGIFNYGVAGFLAQRAAHPMNKPIVGMALSGMSGPASKLVFSTEPGGASGEPRSPRSLLSPLRMQRVIPSRRIISTVTIWIAPGIPTSGGPGVLSTCTSTGENNGAFTFGGCVIDSAGTGYKLIAN